MQEKRSVVDGKNWKGIRQAHPDEDDDVGQLRAELAAATARATEQAPIIPLCFLALEGCSKIANSYFFSDDRFSDKNH